MSHRKKTKRCGDFGGKARSGKPCGQRVKDRMCPSHSDAAAIEVAEKKAVFLEEYRTGICNLKVAAEKAGASSVTVWRWRQEDKHFDEALSEIQENIDDVRNHIVQDSLVARCLKDNCPPALIIFYLVNRMKDRWQHVQHVQFTLDIESMSDEELELVVSSENVTRKLRVVNGGAS